MKRMVAISLVAFLTLSIALIGTAGVNLKAQLIGKWKISAPGLTAVLEYKSDGTAIQTNTGVISGTLNGKYSLTGKIITTTFSNQSIKWQIIELTAKKLVVKRLTDNRVFTYTRV